MSTTMRPLILPSTISRAASMMPSNPTVVDKAGGAAPFERALDWASGIDAEGVAR